MCNLLLACFASVAFIVALPLIATATTGKDYQQALSKETSFRALDGNCLRNALCCITSGLRTLAQQCVITLAGANAAFS
jgi:hypothetical protein